MSSERGGKIYVSLTSIFDNQGRLLKTLQSILDQSLVPDAVFVHLSAEPYLKDQGFPDRRIPHRGLKAFLDRNRDLVKVRWVENTGPYRKLLPLIRDIRERRSTDEETVRIITVDDDLIYHPDVIFNLFESGAACACLRGFAMKVREVGELLSWGYWRKRRLASGSSVFHYATGVGGVLFTLPVFEGLFDVLLDDAIYRACCPTNDDIWFNFLRIANRVPLTVVDAPYVEKDLTNGGTSLWQRFNQAKNNDQIRATSAQLRKIGVL